MIIQDFKLKCFQRQSPILFINSNMCMKAPNLSSFFSHYKIQSPTSKFTAFSWNFTESQVVHNREIEGK